ncbi:uncharacterized protein MELLADRAFT_65591 [Melampsora larici-populina 98AG31]|uniref:Uncharacterized protein n=1 Tax=Melampsora larici-populina (strain 98AG31 / pathotype 3-4-7) TaxID=747676 RepID=F4RVZ9_MELLP|nr:uncharacterized protein MELLADRAFT_65591 [Melampsora larici-populina 98AG31]EGG03447.1 hypothetical protein MELLADRAFT_65591 [Melampsora larici-populina 98AG31]
MDQQTFILLNNSQSQPILEFITKDIPEPNQPVQFNLAVGITIGLIASFIQSLGLTIQRKSHLQNDQLPFHLRKPDYARPIWLMGFIIYFSFNILGSIFQIGTLPLIILGPLGAISLLWNAILAKVLLGDLFSYHLIFGTLLIGAGAILIGIFGVLPGDMNHTLDELIILYSRTPFLIEMSILVFLFSMICIFAHTAEFRLNGHLRILGSMELVQTHHQEEPIKNSCLKTSQTQHRSIHGMLLPDRSSDPFRLRPRRSRSSSDPVPINRLPTPQSTLNPVVTANDAFSNSPLSISPVQESHESDDVFSNAYDPNKTQAPVTDKSQSKDLNESLPPPHLIARTKLFIGLAYGSTSGTLSGICLLFAKTGVELLILTLTGYENQFKKFQTWLILLILLISAILQLWYLNKALKLVNPTLICPLAFCFYNLSSIITSLVYYDQFKLLSDLQVGLIVLGTIILLAGVWIVSLGTSSTTTSSSSSIIASSSSSFNEDPETGGIQTSNPIDEATPLLNSTETFSPTSPTFMDTSFDNSEEGRSAAVIELNRQMSLPSHRRHHQTVDKLIHRFLNEGEIHRVRGFSIGLGAASPGFSIQPSPRRPKQTLRRHSCEGSTADMIIRSSSPHSTLRPHDLPQSETITTCTALM